MPCKRYSLDNLISDAHSFQEYLQNPERNWLKKDTSIFLVLALASKGETQKVSLN